MNYVFGIYSSTTYPLIGKFNPLTFQVAMEGLLPFFYLFPSTCLLPWDNLMAVLSFDDVFHLLPTQLGFSGMIFFFFRIFS